MFVTWKKRLFYTAITPWHWVLRLIYGKKYFQREIRDVKKILLANRATLGDVFLTTILIPALKRRFPGCKIGVMVTPESKIVIEGCPGVDAVHLIEPTFSNGESILSKISNVLAPSRGLIGELKKGRYDLAINTYPYFSDVVPLFLKARIPFRIAFDNRGYRSLPTYLISWEYDKYIGKLLAKLLAPLNIQGPLRSPWLDVDVATPFEGDYTLFHIGSTDTRKELSPEFWKELHKEFLGERVITTGKGERQEAIINEIGEGESATELSWEELLGAVKGAKLVVSVDTVMIHLAAAFGVPYIALYKFTPHPENWYPDGRGRGFFAVEEDGLAKRVTQAKAELLPHATCH